MRELGRCKWRVAIAVNSVHVSSLREQELDDAGLTRHSRGMQRRRACRSPGIDSGTAHYERPEGVDIAGGGCFRKEIANVRPSNQDRHADTPPGFVRHCQKRNRRKVYPRDRESEPPSGIPSSDRKRRECNDPDHAGEHHPRERQDQAGVTQRPTDHLWPALPGQDGLLPDQFSRQERGSGRTRNPAAND